MFTVIDQGVTQGTTDTWYESVMMDSSTATPNVSTYNQIPKIVVNVI